MSITPTLSTTCILNHLPVTKKLLTVGEPLSWHKIARIALVILTAVIPPVLLTLTVDLAIFLFKKIQAKCVTSNQETNPPPAAQPAQPTPPEQPAQPAPIEQPAQPVVAANPIEMSLTGSAFFQMMNTESETKNQADLSSSAVFVPEDTTNTQSVDNPSPKSTGWLTTFVNS